MFYLVKQFFPHAVLLVCFTIFFCVVFYTVIHAIIGTFNFSEKKVQDAKIAFADVLNPTSTEFGQTQLGELLPLFIETSAQNQTGVSPEPTLIPLPTPIPLQPEPTILPPVASLRTLPPSPLPLRFVPIQNVNFADDSVWERLAQCESGNHWNENSGNGFYGGLQFTLGTWAGVGGVGKPSDASRDEQIMRAKMLQSRRGFFPWPACSRKLGLL